MGTRQAHRTPASKAPDKRQARPLRSLVRTAWQQPGIVVAGLLINVMALALPIVILQVYDRVIPNQSRTTLTLLILGLGVVLVLDTILRMARSYVSAWYAARFEHAVGCRAVNRLLASRIAEFEAVAPGAQMERIGTIDTLRDFYAGNGLMALMDLPFALLFLVLIGMIGGPLVLVPVAVIGVAGLSASKIGRTLRAALQRRSEIDARRYNFVVEVMGAIHSVKGLALEAQMARRHERLQESSAEAAYDVNFAAALAQAHSAAFANTTMVVMAIFGSMLVLADHLTLGMLAATTLLAGRSVQPLLRSIAAWTQYQSVRIAEHSLSEVLTLPVESTAERQTAPVLDGAVGCEDLSFAYPGQDGPVLDHLDLHVAAGEFVAITGENGGGKSTLLHLMLGLLQPTAGRVLYDGRDGATFTPTALRSQIAYLPQNGTLYQGTILENLTFFDPARYLDAAMDLSRRLGLDEFFAHLPGGLETRVGGDNTQALPGGARQRIAIIRLLARQPKIILFDEANAALDFGSDRRLGQLLEDYRRKVTIVLVSHRPSTIALADRVLHLDGGVLRRVPARLGAKPAVAQAQAQAQAPAPVQGRDGGAP